jgi:hypothetical protein
MTSAFFEFNSLTNSNTSMDDAPPLTDHVLRPHHVMLLSILMIAYKDLKIKKLPAPFALHLHRVLLNEIAEARMLFVKLICSILTHY